MIHTSRQVKDLIRNQSKGNSAKAQILLRIYMMERFLERLSVSDYNKNFILKGGMLVSSMVGIDMRSTMDIDTTLKNLPLSEESVKNIIENITAIKLDDNINLRIKSISEIMEEAEYGGIRVSLEAVLDMMRVPLKIDISTGDVITPREIEYEMPLMFENRKIAVLAYNTETLLAEKLETIIARGTVNTRLRDFYDIYIILNNSVYEINDDNFSLAFRSTCKKRRSDTLIANAEMIISEIEVDGNMQNLWRAYRNKFEYAKDISWDMVIGAVKQLLHIK